MLHYILRFTITMKHVIYGEILSAARASGEHYKLPQRGLGRSPSRNRIWCILAWKSDIVGTNFSFSMTFPKKYFPLTFPWPLKFPDFFQFSLTYRNPGTWYSASYMSQTRDQKRVTISEVAADWHELMIPQLTMRPSVAHTNKQLDLLCSQQTYHHPN